MNTSDPRTLEGWSIAAYEQFDAALPWRVVATHDTGESKSAEAMDLETALLWLAKKTGIDRDLLKSAYGL